MRQTSRAYISSHIILRDEIYKNWKAFSEKLSEGPNAMREYLYNVWMSINIENVNPDVEIIDIDRKVTIDDFNITTAVFNGTRVFFMIFPEPDHNFAQAKCVALALEQKMPRYFTMEITEIYNNQKKYMVCEWALEIEGFNHLNYGEMNLNTIDEFAGYISKFIDEDIKREEENKIGIKQETLNLINLSRASFTDVFSICIPQMYLINKRFAELLGNYSKWSVDVNTGKLMIDDKALDVEFIGTTMPNKDNMWFSAELENIIPDQFVNLTIKSRKALSRCGLNSLSEGKIELNDDITGYKIAMINCAICPQNVAYFCGSGETNVYMFVKNLPEEIFKKVELSEFATVIMELISNFNVKHRLLVKAFLIENNIEYTENREEIIAKYNQESTIVMKFNNDRLENCIINKL